MNFIDGLLIKIFLNYNVLFVFYKIRQIHKTFLAIFKRLPQAQAQVVSETDRPKAKKEAMTNRITDK